MKKQIEILLFNLMEGFIPAGDVEKSHRYLEEVLKEIDKTADAILAVLSEQS